MCWTKYSLEKTQPRETRHFVSAQRGENDFEFIGPNTVHGSTLLEICIRVIHGHDLT